MKRARKKPGFTLIELIVVLVIMAILAAAAIPTMMGYVEKAKGAQHVAEARIIYVAATAAYTEAYGVYGQTPTEALMVQLAPGLPPAEPTDARSLIEKRVYEMCIAGIPMQPGEKSAEAFITGTAAGSVTKVEYHTSFLLDDSHRWYVTIEIGPGGENTATWEKR